MQNYSWFQMWTWMEIWLNSSGSQSQFDGKPSWGEERRREGGKEVGGTPAVSDTLMSLSNHTNCHTPSGSLVRVLHRQLPSELSTIFMINGSIRKKARSGRLSLRWTSVVVLFFLHFLHSNFEGVLQKICFWQGTQAHGMFVCVHAQLCPRSLRVPSVSACHLVLRLSDEMFRFFWQVLSTGRTRKLQRTGEGEMN